MDIFQNSATIKKFFQTSELPQCILSAQRSYLEVNQAFADLLGYSREELCTMSVNDTTVPDDLGMTHAVLTEAGRQSLNSFHLRKRYLRKDGSQITLDLSSTVARDDAGAIIGYLTTLFPVEFGQNRPPLETHDSLLRAMFQNMTEGYSLLEVVTNPDGTATDFRYLDANAAYEKHTGQVRKEIIGKTVRETNPDADPEMIRRYIDVALTGREFSVEYRSKTFGRNLKVKAFPAGPGRFAAVFEDITDRVNAQRAMERENRLSSLGMLAGGLAHDFNNLLTGFSTRVELAMLAEDRSVSLQHLVKASKALDQARDLTRRLLVFSKGGQSEMRPGSLSAVVRDAAELCLAGTNCVLDWRVPDDLPFCQFDANQLSQVFNNLLLNAVQAMPAGGTISIDGAAEQEVLRVTISDTGTGIPAELLDKVFDPFFSTKPSGTGLGLAMVHSIITSHAGKIHLESKVNEGTTITVEIPLILIEPTAETPEEPKDSQVSTAKREAVIVLLEDETEIRESLTELLITLGYTVLPTSEGLQTVETITTRYQSGLSVDMVLADLTVPGGQGGLQILGPLKDLDPDLPVVAMSGYSELPIMAEPLKYTFTASLKKPFDRRQLEATIELYRKHRT
jgi:PAS domain S-box-containing protein